MDRPVAYQIKVPGHLDQSWVDWAGGMVLTVADEGDGGPVTTLTGTVDQAALQGLLRRLYSLGLPLISVIWAGSAGCSHSDPGSTPGSEKDASLPTG